MEFPPALFVLSPYDTSSDAGASSQDEHAFASSSTQSSMTEQAAEGATVLRLRGLPFNANADDLRAFFHLAGNELQEVCFCRRDGRPTGEAYVVLSPSSDVQACFTQLDKKYIGRRYIELFEASSADLRAVKKMLEDRSMQGFVVRLRGLPYTAKEADVRAFLDGIQLSAVPDCIVLAHAPTGRPTGEAYVELADEQALTLAMTRHKEVMGARYIEVFNSSKMDKLQAQKQLEALSRQSLDHHGGFLPAVTLPYSSAAGGPQRGCTALLQQQQYPVHMQLQPYPPAPLSGAAFSDLLANSFAQCHLTPSTSPHRGSPAGATAGAVVASLGLAAATEPLRSLHQSHVLLPTAVGAASLSPPGLQLPAGSQHSLLQQPGALMARPDGLVGRSPAAAARMPAAACMPATAGMSGAACMPAGVSAVGVTGVTLAQLLPMHGLMPLPAGAAGVPASVGPSAGVYLQQQHQLDGQLLQQHPGVAQHGMSACMPAGGLQLPQGPYQQLSYSQQPLAAQPVMTAVTTAAAVQQQQQRQMAMAAGWGPHVPLQHCN